MKKKLKFSTDHRESAFYSNNVTVSHNPSKFIVDFTQAAPRFDQIRGERKCSLVIKHKTIALDPPLAKEFLQVLNENLRKYEEKFGKISIKKKKKKIEYIR